MSLLKANPEFSRRKIVLVYDCDTKKPSETIDLITVMGLQPIPYRRVQKGVENLLRPAGIPEELYKPKTHVSDYGETTKSEKLDKTALCALLCGADADVENFKDFEPVLEAIRAAVSGGASDSLADSAVDGGSRPRVKRQSSPLAVPPMTEQLTNPVPAAGKQIGRG